MLFMDMEAREVGTWDRIGNEFLVAPGCEAHGEEPVGLQAQHPSDLQYLSFSSGIAPTPWGRIVFMTKTRQVLGWPHFGGKSSDTP